MGKENFPSMPQDQMREASDLEHLFVQRVIDRHASSLALLRRHSHIMANPNRENDAQLFRLEQMIEDESDGHLTWRDGALGLITDGGETKDHNAGANSNWIRGFQCNLKLDGRTFEIFEVDFSSLEKNLGERRKEMKTVEMIANRRSENRREDIPDFAVYIGRRDGGIGFNVVLLQVNQSLRSQLIKLAA